MEDFRLRAADGENYVVVKDGRERGYVYHRCHSPRRNIWRWERWDDRRQVIDHGASRTLADAASNVVRRRDRDG